MIRALTLVLVLLIPTAALAQAPSLAPYLGEWQGEGALRLDDEPEQRFQCRLRMQDQRVHVFLVGRCASAQGSTSFAYLLTEPAPGRISGENAQPVETDLPATLDGQVGADGDLVLRRAGSTNGTITFARRGGALTFTLAADGTRGRAEGTVTLQPR